MSNKEMMAHTDHHKNSSEKDTNINSDFQKKFMQDSPNTEENEKDKPIHFQVEYDQNKNFENQIESSPEANNNKSKTHSQYTSNKKEQQQQEFIIEKNNQIENNPKNKKNAEFFGENNNNFENVPNNQYYNLLKENFNNNNNEIPLDDNNFNNYYYYYLNNYNNRNIGNNEEDEEPKKVISFATRTYQNHIDPVHLNRKYNDYWKRQNKSKQKYQQKINALQKVFHPNGYNTITKSFKRKGMSQSRYSTSTRISINNYDRPSFDNTKQPLPKASYLVVPYDYGINDPYYGKEDPSNYDRKKMVKLRMLKQPLKYYYPYTNDNFRNKKNFKYE